MATNYGSDTYCITDIPLVDIQVTAPQQIIGQRVARRLTTPRGALGLIGDDGNFGFDVRQFFNAKLSPTEIATAQQQIADECLKDEQVGTATVELTYVAASGDVSIRVRMTSAAGPFAFVLQVSQLTAALIFEAPQ